MKKMNDKQFSTKLAAFEAIDMDAKFVDLVSAATVHSIEHHDPIRFNQLGDVLVRKRGAAYKAYRGIVKALCAWPMGDSLVVPQGVSMDKSKMAKLSDPESPNFWEAVLERKLETLNDSAKENPTSEFDEAKYLTSTLPSILLRAMKKGASLTQENINSAFKIASQKYEEWEEVDSTQSTTA